MQNNLYLPASHINSRSLNRKTRLQSPVRLIAASLLAAICLLMISGVSKAHAQQEQMTDTTDTVSGNVTEESEEEQGSLTSKLLGITGFYVSGSGGAYRRVNNYYSRNNLIDIDLSESTEENVVDNLMGSYDKPINYRNKSLRVYDLYLETGFYNRALIKYNYQTSKFGQQRLDSRLEVQEEQQQGLEKYTYGINLAPIARSFIEDEGFFGTLALNLLSVQYIRTKEITQSVAAPQQEVLYITPETNINYSRQTAENFNTISANDTYSFKVTYNYEEISAPIFRVKDFTIRGMYFDEAYFGVGWARYSYARPLLNDYFNLNFTPFVYDSKLQAKSIMLTFSNARRQNAVRNGLFIEGKFGFSYDNEFTATGLDMDRMYYPPSESGDDRRGAAVNSIHSTATAWYKLPFTPEDAGMQIALNLGASISQFSIATTETSELNIGDQTNTISNTDWLMELWANLRISI